MVRLIALRWKIFQIHRVLRDNFQRLVGQQTLKLSQETFELSHQTFELSQQT
jgi:hypothetical protein